MKAMLALCVCLTAFSSNLPDVNEVVRKVDEMYRSDTSSSTVEMKIVTPHWERTLSMNIWTEKLDKTFVRILSPKKEKGMATLRIHNEMWNYLPKTNKVIKVPPSMMMGSWMGSDFTNDDLVKEFSFVKDYSFQLEENPESETNMILTSIPREGLPVIWDRIVSLIDRKTLLPLWHKYYDEKGKLIRTMIFKDVKTFQGKLMPAVMELLPAKKEGNRTIVTYKEMRFDVPLEDSVFSLRNLRKRGE